MLFKKAITSVAIDDNLSKRWSCRAFDIDKKVSRERIIALCEAGRWAPSCFGDEPWRFIVFDKNHNADDYQKAFDCIGDWNQRWIINAPVIILALADKNFRKNGKTNRWAEYDTGAAVENIAIQSVAMGLMSHPIAGFDDVKVMKEFEIPDNFIPLSMLAIGYQAEPEILEDEFKKEEIKERVRRPLGENFFDGAWNKPIA